MAQKFTVPITVKQLTTAGSDAITVYVDADTYARLKVEAGGRLVWGSGSGAGDVNLYRDGADVLRTDDTFKTPTLFVDSIEIDPTGATTDQVLKFDGTKFVAATAPSGGASTLDGLNDVTAPSPSSGDFLKWNGSAWVNDPINLGTDTTGDYIQSLVAGTNVVITNNSGEGSTPTISISGNIGNFDSIATPDYVQFDTSVVGASANEGRLQWDSDFGALSFGLEGNNTTVKIGFDNVAYCYNADTVTLTKGTPVYIFGGQGSQVSIKRASNTSDATSARTLGLVSESIAPSASGYVVTYGVLTGIDTSAYTLGQILYLGATAGTLTTTKPYAPNHYVFIGVVVKVGVGGEIWLRPQNGYELEEIHDVDLVTTPPVSGDFLKYNGTLWVNDAINLGTDTVGDYVSSVSGGTGISVNFSPGEGVGASVSLNATLDDLSDVSTTGASAGNVLTFNGSSWTAASVAAGGASVTVSETAPAGASSGDLWFESDTARTYVYYDSSWIEIGALAPTASISDSAPSSPVAGQIWFNSLNGGTYVYYSGVWAEIGALPYNTLMGLIDAKGDLLVGTADNIAGKLGVGSAGQVLTVDSSTATGLKWAAIPPSGGLSTSTEGAIMTMAIGA